MVVRIGVLASRIRGRKDDNDELPTNRRPSEFNHASDADFASTAEIHENHVAPIDVPQVAGDHGMAVQKGAGVTVRSDRVDGGKMLLSPHGVDALNVRGARCEPLPYLCTPIEGLSIAQPSDRTS